MNIETNNSKARQPPSVVTVPYEELLAKELERRTEYVRARDNVGRGEAYSVALHWLQGETQKSLLSVVEVGLYRIWYSDTDNGSYRELAVWFEGSLYHWPATSQWLQEHIQEHIDPRCYSIGTFVRCDAAWEREWLNQTDDEMSAETEGS